MQNDIKLKDGALLPRIGLGTWLLGDKIENRQQEIEALQAGIDMGMKVIDTAEMYGHGRSEQLVGEAISKYNREDVFVVSKVFPHNAGRQSIGKSLRQSLNFLNTEYLDARVIIGTS